MSGKWLMEIVDTRGFKHIINPRHFINALTIADKTHVFITTCSDDYHPYIETILTVAEVEQQFYNAMTGFGGDT